MTALAPRRHAEQGNLFWLGIGLFIALGGALLPGLAKLLLLPLVLLPMVGQVTRRPYWALFPAILFCPFNFESLIERIGIPLVNPFNGAWLLAAGSLAFWAWQRRRFPVTQAPVDRFLILNITAMTLTVINAWQVIPASHYGDTVMTYQQWLQWIIFYWVTAGLVRNGQQAQMVALAIVGMVAVAAAFGIKDYVATRAVSGGAIERSQGLFGQANYAASFFAYYLPVVVAVGSSITRWWGRVLVLVAAGSGTLACVLTFGRGGIMALGLAVVVVAVLKRSRTLMIALFIGGLVIGADPTVQARFAETTQDKGSDSVELDDSSGARLIAWRKALDLAGQRPLTGWGFLAFRHIHHPLDAEAAARFGHGRMDVHNGHLNALVSGGLLGSAALYLMYGSIVVWCLRIRRQSRDPFTVALATGMIASVLAIMVVNLTGTRLYDRQLHGYFWMLLGTLAGAVAAEGRGRVQE